MNYEQIDIRPIPVELKSRLVTFIKSQLANNAQCAVTYGRFETSNKNSIAYTTSESDWTAKYGKHGNVTFYYLSNDLREELTEYYKDIDHPFFKNGNYTFQVLDNATHTPPHADDRHARTEGIIYLLEAGGPEVETVWYDVVDKYDKDSVPDATAIPYENLIRVESHVLKEDHWHYLKFDKVHSVENLKGTRLAINFAPEL